MTGYRPSEPTASTLGVPHTWFRREVEAGRIPFLDIGGRRLFDVEAVKAALKEQETVAAAEGADNA